VNVQRNVGRRRLGAIDTVKDGIASAITQPVKALSVMLRSSE
jgi:hypothetical protein